MTTSDPTQQIFWVASRALGIVGVRHRRAEYRHHVVADMLVDGAAAGLDDIVHRLKVAIEQGAALFRTEVIRQCSET